jgi:hypothetical protein
LCLRGSGSVNSLDVLLANLVNAKSEGNYPHLFPFGISKAGC